MSSQGGLHAITQPAMHKISRTVTQIQHNSYAANSKQVSLKITPSNGRTPDTIITLQCESVSQNLDRVLSAS